MIPGTLLRSSDDVRVAAAGSAGIPTRRGQGAW